MDSDRNENQVVVSSKGPMWLPRYNSPLVQVGLIGLVCFCCPGMYWAQTGMGGGSQVDHKAANNANTALYTAFAVLAYWVGGSTTYLALGSPCSVAVPPISSMLDRFCIIITTVTRLLWWLLEHCWGLELVCCGQAKEPL